MLLSAFHGRSRGCTVAQVAIWCAGARIVRVGYAQVHSNQRCSSTHQLLTV